MWIVLIIVGVIAAGLSAGLLLDAPNRREIRDLPIAAVDFKRLRDGTYEGYFDGGKSAMRAARVRVIVSGGAVTDIDAVVEGGDGKPQELSQGLTIDDLFGRVVAAQTLQVDTITGATLTSKANLKAVEDALNQAQ